MRRPPDGPGYQAPRRRCRGTSLALVTSLTLYVVLGGSPALGQGSVTLDHVDGLSQSGKLLPGVPVTFHIRLSNLGALGLVASTNGFRIHSPDGAVWHESEGDTISVGWGEMYDGGFYVNSRSITGDGADTIGFGGFAVEEDGIGAGFDQITFLVSTQVDFDQTGRTICLDSCYYPPAGLWFWSHGTSGNTVPDWNGPHCWQIGCCNGMRGNLNDDPEEGIDISDLIYLVDYMFNGGLAPVCPEEGDVNGDGSDVIDISDLAYLTEYMFGGGLPPPGCP